ncbi:hypothetical protein [Microbacterium sp. NPDC057658]|uniref:hypothetical protein n=1 Tax=unclassified Microbacterium TaxID=2609290 RepID=UPI00366F69DE
MTHTVTQRLTVTLPLLGVAFLLASMFLPVQLAVVAWGLALITFLVALVCALDARRRRGPSDVSRRELVPTMTKPIPLRVGARSDASTR